MKNHLVPAAPAAGALRCWALGGAALALVLAPGAAAAQGAAEDKSKDKVSEVTEVVVTATGTNISNVKPVGSEAISISREEIRALGRLTVGDVVRTLPQVQSLGFTEQAISAAYGGNAGGAQSARGANGANTSRGSQINIRGLPGANSTLLLVDGRRLAPSGVQAQFQEANQVPLAAVERIEVIADGASAIYGSDAISGVVNFVLRKRYDGLEVSARYGEGKYGGPNFSASLVAGRSWESLGRFGEGNVIFSYEHSTQQPIVRGKVPYLRADLRRFGGEDNRINGAANYNGTPNFSLGTNGNLATAGNPGNIVVPGVAGSINPSLPAAQANIYYGLPALTGNAIPTLGQLRLNQPNLIDVSDYEDLQPKTRRDQFSLFVRQELTPWLTAFYEGFLTERDTRTRVWYAGNSFNSIVQVNPGTPYYISGLTGATDRAYFVQYDAREHFRENGRAFSNDTPSDTQTHTFGLEGELPREWKGEGYLTYGRNRSCGVCYVNNFLSGDRPILFEADVNAGRINPYTTDPLSPSQIARVMGSNIQIGRNRFWDGVLKFNGPVFDLPAGQVKVAVGAEYTHTVSRVRNGANRPCDQFILGVSCSTPDNIFRWDANSRSVRKQYSAFGEIYVPVVGEANALPLVEELILNAAVRYDHYNDFGETTNPKVGVTWKPHRDLTFRGSWGASFRAPGLPDTDPRALSAATQVTTFPNNSGDPRIANTLVVGANRFTNILFLNGGNPEVSAETGEHWSMGFDFQPAFIDGLKISATYFNIKYEDRIGAPPVANYLQFGGAANAYLAEFVTAVTPPAACVNTDPASWAPEVRGALAGDVYGPNTIGFLYNASTIINPCGIRAILDGRVTNLALTKQDGLDVTATYTFETDIGVFTVGGTYTKILNNRSKAFEGGAYSDELDRIYFPISERARANVTWYRGAASATLFANYVGSFLNDQPILRYRTTGQVRDANSRVPSWTTFDFSLNYAFDEAAVMPLQGVRLGVNVTNLFDKDPPVVLSGTAAAAASVHSVYGRTWAVQLTKAF